MINGGDKGRFGLRLMLLIVSLKLLGMSYEKIGSLLKLLFSLDLTEAAMIKNRDERLRTKMRLEARIDALIASYSSSGEKNCRMWIKRLERERGMLFTFLEEDGVDWNNNAAERALRSSVVIRKITYGNQSDEGAAAHAVLMSVRQTCGLRKENFFDYSLAYLNPTSER